MFCVSPVLEAIGGNARAGRIAEAAAFGEVVVLAVPWDAVEQVLKKAGDLTGKIIIDVTNSLAPSSTGLSVGHTTSAGEKVAKWLPGAKVVKAFNSVGSSTMANPEYGESQASLYFCGDDAQAKLTVAELAEAIGFEAIDCGPLLVSRCLEPLALLWIRLAYFQGLGSEIAFQFMRRLWRNR